MARNNSNHLAGLLAVIGIIFTAVCYILVTISGRFGILLHIAELCLLFSAIISSLKYIRGCEMWIQILYWISIGVIIVLILNNWFGWFHF